MAEPRLASWPFSHQDGTKSGSHVGPCVTPFLLVWRAYSGGLQTPVCRGQGWKKRKARRTLSVNILDLELLEKQDAVCKGPAEELGVLQSVPLAPAQGFPRSGSELGPGNLRLTSTGFLGLEATAQRCVSTVSPSDETGSPAGGGGPCGPCAPTWVATANDPRIKPSPHPSPLGASPCAHEGTTSCPSPLECMGDDL